MDKLSPEKHTNKQTSRATASTLITYRTFVKRRMQECRKRKKQQRIHEYRRLRTMVPSISKKTKVSKVTVIEEAIRYIDQLHNALLARLKTRGLPRCMQDMNIDVDSLSHGDIKDLVCEVMSNTPSSSVPVLTTDNSSRERNRIIPSYFIRKQKKLAKLSV